MSQLYSISFTPKILTRVIGKGRREIETHHSAPVVMHALPYATAMSYKTAGADNFTITPYHPDDRWKSKGSGRDAKVGNGTKRTHHVAGSAAVTTAKTAKPKTNTTVTAATTGNMAAAINEARK